jgi:hypothetical protein
LNCASPRRKIPAVRRNFEARRRKNFLHRKFEGRREGRGFALHGRLGFDGQGSESAERLKQLSGYQINQKLVKLAKPDALVMHCLPAYRGKEIDEETFEANADTIFTQAENRLHVQKAILNWAVGS